MKIVALDKGKVWKLIHVMNIVCIPVFGLRLITHIPVTERLSSKQNEIA